MYLYLVCQLLSIIKSLQKGLGCRRVRCCKGDLKCVNQAIRNLRSEGRLSKTDLVLSGALSDLRCNRCPSALVPQHICRFLVDQEALRDHTWLVPVLQASVCKQEALRHTSVNCAWQRKVPVNTGTKILQFNQLSCRLDHTGCNWNLVQKLLIIRSLQKGNASWLTDSVGLCSTARVEKRTFTCSSTMLARGTSPEPNG